MEKINHLNGDAKNNNNNNYVTKNPNINEGCKSLTSMDVFF